MTTDAPSKTNTSERRRGYQEARQKIELLRTKWPQAFPAKAHAVRPLTNGAQQAIIETFGWSAAYARAVLSVWKLGPAYCNAILRYPKRINLDGSPSDEEIDDRSRAAATARLEQRAERQAKERAKAERQKLQVTATLKAIEQSAVPPEHLEPVDSRASSSFEPSRP
jgi:sRNA-binding protein